MSAGPPGIRALRGGIGTMGNFRCTLTQTDAFLPGGDPFPRRGRAEVPPRNSGTPDSAIVGASDTWSAPVSGRLVQEALERRRAGYDIGSDPVYFHKPSAEPRPELVGTLWQPGEGRGKTQRRYVRPNGTYVAPVEMTTGRTTGSNDVPAAGIGSEHLRSTRNQTRTGLKLTRDCWGNAIP
jgi:hypothetical protein|mmetsp:Transcript_8344/g.27799  ORF Transcript_8344/g.27799 Transcript_8344/m.27799 type:complete len:181 (+) Transcript_8344:24-566(+)